MNISHKHTPGPWKTQTHISLDRLEIRDADGRRIAACAMDFPMSAKTHDANAHLIAAAPELLAALEEAKQFIQNGIEYGYINIPEKQDHDSATETPGKIEAAISKAKGTNRSEIPNSSK